MMIKFQQELFKGSKIVKGQKMLKKKRLKRLFIKSKESKIRKGVV